MSEYTNGDWNFITIVFGFIFGLWWVSCVVCWVRDISDYFNKKEGTK
jgi:hypothetical protein